VKTLTKNWRDHYRTHGN